MTLDMLRLRDYQQECSAAVDASHARGVRRPAIVLPTGAGKTVIFAHRAMLFCAVRENLGKRVLVLAHTDELVTQAAKKIKGVAPHLQVGIVKAAKNEAQAQVVVASVQSLRSAKRRAQIRNVGLIITDECFPAGTLVGGRPIESLKPGDMVPSWDESTGHEVLAPVVALMRRAPEHMVRVTLASGDVINCTPNHPILTNEGWCPAGVLAPDVHVVSFTHDANADFDGLHMVRRARDADGQGSNRPASSDRPGILRTGAPGCLGEQGPVGAHGADQPQARVGTDAAQQPDGAAGGSGEDDRDPEGDRTSAAGARRERQADSGAAGEVGGIPRVAGRVDRGAGGRGDAVSLQAGHRTPRDEGVRGGGRGVPFLSGPPSLRPAPGRAAVTTRVADVQVLERGGDGTYGGVCPDGAVYNIEVAGTHTYLIGDGVVAHNCHHATASTYQAIFKHYGAMPPGPDDAPGTYPVYAEGEGALAEGFTATLARSDKSKLSEIWQEVAFKRDIAFMIRRKYLLDVRGKTIKVPDFTTKGLKISGGDFASEDLAERLTDSLAPEMVAKAYAEVAADRSGLVFTPNVASAYVFAAHFNAEGISAEVVHGALPQEERRLIIKRLEAGDTQVLVNCMVLTEGFDSPRVSCVVVARPTKSSPLYQQMIGRGLRLFEGQTDCLVLDVVGASRMHGLASLVDLSSRDDRPEELLDGQSLLEFEDQAELLEQEETGAGMPEEYYNGPIELVDFDPLSRDSHRVWKTTASGVHYLPMGATNAREGTQGLYYFLVEDEVWADACEPGTYSVMWCTQDGRNALPVLVDAGLPAGRSVGLTEHAELPISQAMVWAEQEVEELAIRQGLDPTETFSKKTAPWRKREASSKQINMARGLGIDVTGWADDPFGKPPRAGEVSDMIDNVKAAKVIDHWVQYLTSLKESK